MKELVCPKCGGNLKNSGGVYTCSFCSSTFENDTNNLISQFEDLLELQEQKALSNLRVN